jgi:hypothetical protein
MCVCVCVCACRSVRMCKYMYDNLCHRANCFTKPTTHHPISIYCTILPLQVCVLGFGKPLHMIKSVEYILTLQQLAVVFETASQKIPTRYTHPVYSVCVCLTVCVQVYIHTHLTLPTSPHYNTTHPLLNTTYSTPTVPHTTTLQHYNNPPNPHHD